MQNNERKKWHVSKGARNLIVLGVLSIVIATLTTGVSLAWYHLSGDIYLDRSRPGFMPDEEEVKKEEKTEDDYDFSKSGELTVDVLEEYLNRLNDEVQAIDEDKEPFSTKVLSDAELDIPKSEE